MNRFTKLLKRAAFASLFCLAALTALPAIPVQAAPAKAKTTKTTEVTNSFDKPDFAFPQTVERNAQEKFDHALAQGDGLTALRAALQLNVASNLVSSDSYAASLARFETMANRLPAPWSNLSLLLEARLYQEIYSASSWTYNNRTLPLTPRPENVKEWSMPMFAAVTGELVDKAFRNSAAMAEMPLSEISLLLSNYDDAVKAGFSVLDFMTIQGVDCLSQFKSRGGMDKIPFGDGNSTVATDPADAASATMALIDAAIERHSGDTDKFIESYFCNMRLGQLTGATRSAYIKECMDRFGDTPYCASFINAYISDNLAEEEVMPLAENGQVTATERTNSIERRKLLMLEDYISRFPDAAGVEQLRAEVNSIKSRLVKLTFPDQLLPGRSNKIHVDSKNLYKFYILVYELPVKGNVNDFDGSLTVGAMKATGKLIHAVPVEFSGTTPDMIDGDVELPALKPGRYAFVASSTASDKGLLGKRDKDRVSTALVSGISAVQTRGDVSGPGELYIVSALNQKPLAGVKVTLTTIVKGKPASSVVKRTDADGRITYENGEYLYRAEYDGSIIGGSINKDYKPGYSKQVLQSELLTDLSIYRPGDRVQFTGVAFTSTGKEMKAAPSRKLRVWLNDANMQSIDSLDITTDGFGRYDGAFTLPKSGMLGNWAITVREDRSWICNRYFDVADYKAPTFEVAVDSSSESYKAGDVLSFGGKAVTYAGMPVAGGKVAYTVQYQPLWWWRRSASAAQYGGETETNADGSFTIKLPTEGLKGTAYAHGSYILKVSVTDAAGETREARALSFGLGSALSIVSSVPSVIKADSDSQSYKVTVYDLASHPVQKKLYYDLSAADGKGLMGGEFESPSFRLDLKDIPSGRYRLRFSLSPDFKDSEEYRVVSDSITVWRADDKRPPVVTPLWVPETEIVLGAGEKKAKIRVGSSYNDSYLLALVSDSQKRIRTEWVRVSDGFATVTVDAPSDTDRVFVEFLGERDLNRISQTVTVIPHAQDVKLEIVAESFRDRIDPGATETWKFRFTADGRNCASLPAMAVMSNKALNALSPFQWAFNPYASLYWGHGAWFNYNHNSTSSNWATVSVGDKIKSSASFEVPSWNTYGYGFYRTYGGYGQDGSDSADKFFLSSVQTTAAPLRVRGGARKAAAAPSNGVVELAEESVVNEMKYEDSEEVYSTGAVRDNSVAANQNDVPLRNIDVPLAFFKPTLVTDSQGIATVDFTAPDFVGTWQFQILGYTPDMRGNVLTLDAVASKRVMAQLNAPRFVRTGDKMSVAATLYNNSDSDASVAGRIELIDPLTDRVLLSQQFDGESVSASGSRVVKVMYEVPSEIEAMTIRVYATVPGFSDGEQTVIPVLPSSTPVVESTPFYIKPEAGQFSIKLPKFDKDSKVTLTYCDNPVWECVTALPGMLRPESVNILSHVNALFGNAVASGLLTRYPELLAGIEKMAAPENSADSALVSPLQKNEQLKTVLLNNTPWVNDAKAETLRMQSLVEYADKSKAQEQIASVMKTLTDRQNSDGGWSWCPEMKSSTFMTRSVLHTLASLAGMGYLPEGGEKLAKRACEYLDKQYADDWNRSDRKSVPVTALLNYLYDKSCFKGIGSASSFKPLETVAMKEIKAKWRDFGIYDKATAAMLLESRKDASTARTILESLRQFASVSPEKGMWYDNLSSRGYGDNALLTTARVLEAYAAIEPSNPAIDQLRQWMVITKQTQNWGDNRRTAEAIHALLTSGTEWTVPPADPVITLDGRQLEISGISAVKGAFTLDLNPTDASKATLTVNRSGSGPAWGGVVAQYVAPILDVKPASVPQLSIEKKVYTVTPGASGTTASEGDMAVGNRVRVTLTITCDRDIEYVAVTDPRAACLEPVDQLSGYTQSDGVWYYREVRDASTNLFIPFLSKGTHVISYDCNADREGDYTLGVATAQSQYAPEITAHSAGALLPVR